MPADYRVISIGTLAAHPLWDERVPVRTGHATTTLVSAGDRHVLVDPGLPPTALVARLAERSRVKPDEITDVFLTRFDSDHARGVARFARARWLLTEAEREWTLRSLRAEIERAEAGGDEELLEELRARRGIAERFRAAEDRVAPGVDLFPLPGVSPGSCGLLLPLPTSTVLVCGDAVATIEHLRGAKVLPGALDVERAQESFREAIEIADVLILGRDNVAMNPLREMRG
jgi:glyoxylase-like metal-dependent hydrolase (beta-lactamase superfamily II)